MTVLVAVGLAALAVAVATRPSPHVGLRRLAGPDSAVRRPGRTLLRARRTHLLILVPATTGAVVLALVGVRGVVLAGTAAVVTAGVLKLRGMASARRSAARMRGRTVEICDALAAELGSGQPARVALSRVAAEHDELAPAARAAALGGDVPDALRLAGGDPGARGFAAIAAAWQVSEASGASLAATLQRIAGSLRSDEATAGRVEAALGPPRATARLLAILPVVGLALGGVLGGDPLTFLLKSLWGNALLAVGSALALAGVAWVERLSSKAVLQ